MINVFSAYHRIIWFEKLHIDFLTSFRFGKYNYLVNCGSQSPRGVAHVAILLDGVFKIITEMSFKDKVISLHRIAVFMSDPPLPDLGMTIVNKRIIIGRKQLNEQFINLKKVRGAHKPHSYSPFIILVLEEIEMSSFVEK